MVNRVTKEANWTRSEIFVSGRFVQSERMTGDVGYVINDIAAVRLNALYEDAGFRDGVNMERLGISPTVTIKPTNRTK